MWENPMFSNLKAFPTIPIEPDVWESNLIITSPVIYLPHKVSSICRGIQNQMKEVAEFSVLFKGEWMKEGYFVSEEYILPKQTVSAYAVDYEEDLAPFRKQGYEVMLHKHPANCTSFSYADETTVNMHFPISLLFVNNRIEIGNIMVQVAEGIKLSFPAIIKNDEDNSYEMVDISNIKHVAYSPPTYKYKEKSKYHGNYLENPLLDMPYFFGFGMDKEVPDEQEGLCSHCNCDK